MRLSEIVRVALTSVVTRMDVEFGVGVTVAVSKTRVGVANLLFGLSSVAVGIEVDVISGTLRSVPLEMEF